MLNSTNTIYYSNVYVSLQRSDVRYQLKINRQKSFRYKMSIRRGIVGYVHFRASVQIPLTLQTFWTGEIKLELLYFLRF